MRKVSATLLTAGDGYWSRAKKEVDIIGLDLAYVDEEEDFGELRVYFDTRTWDVNTDGLIYTDNLFERRLREFLNLNGYDGNDVTYSEQGMQGDDYVSCDVGGDFIKSFGEES